MQKAIPETETARRDLERTFDAPIHTERDADGDVVATITRYVATHRADATLSAMKNGVDEADFDVTDEATKTGSSHTKITLTVRRTGAE